MIHWTLRVRNLTNKSLQCTCSILILYGLFRPLGFFLCRISIWLIPVNCYTLHFPNLIEISVCCGPTLMYRFFTSILQPQGLRNLDIINWDGQSQMVLKSHHQSQTQNLVCTNNFITESIDPHQLHAQVRWMIAKDCWNMLALGLLGCWGCWQEDCWEQLQTSIDFFNMYLSII